MAKSFKRAIACLLAVLMVAFSMPFTAMAAVGDYEPDIEIYFYPIYTDGLGNYEGVAGSKKGVDPAVGAGSLSDVAFDYKNGTLSVTPEKYAAYLEYNEMGADEVGVFGEDGTETWTLGEGDFFGVVVVCKNIDTLFAIQGALKFSDNITPAGYDRSLTGSGAKQRNVLTLRALNDPDAEGDWAYEGYSDDVSGSLYGLDTEMNEIDANGNIFFGVAGDDPYSDVSFVAGGEDFFNPTTGALGYDFENECILGTYMFQITGNGPITFEAADPENNIYPNYKGGMYIASKDEGIRNPDDYTTVAGGTHAGAGKMTYFAEASQQEECTHEHTTTTYENVVDATCTEAGSRDVVVTCDDCGEEISRNNETLPAIGHDLGEWAETTAAVAPTCTEAGATAIETRTCSRCDYSETRGGEEVAALGHTYAEEVTAPTCTEAGYTTYTCTRCGDTYTEAGDPATGHTAAEAVVENNVDPTCTEAGSYDSVVYCSVCGAEISRETVDVDALGHDFGEWQSAGEGVAPTCTTDGVDGGEIRYCSRCDATETRGGEVLPALGHDFVAGEVVAPTCTEAGYTVYECSRCDATENRDETAALGHDFGEWTVTTEPSCTEAGEETRYCLRCDETETRPVDALEHIYEAVVTEPTCTDGGYTTYTCARCGDTYTADETEALGHNYEAVVTEPTCTDGGYTTYTCSRCGDTYTADATEALGHDWGEWITTKEATEEEEGEAQRTCARCGEVETKAIPKADHVHVPAEAVEENRVEATCTEAGSYDLVVYCEKCGEEISRDAQTIDALGHDIVVDEAVAPTCTETGLTAGEHCSRCDYAVAQEEVPALGHDYQLTDHVDATRDAAGYDEYTCSRCGDSYQVEIPAIEGVKITTVITGEGEVEFSNNNIGMEDDGFLYTYGDQYKLTATPVDGYKFEGWYYGSRLLSTEKVYNNVAYVDLDVTAKFVEDAQEAFTVTFLGKYGDVKSEQTVSAGDQIEVPAPSDLPGYEFVAWTIDGAEVDEAAIKALTDSAVVQATYKKLTTGEFTITADGATITLPNGITNGSIPYDTKATVKFEGAESIVAVDANGAETVVATGDTYTFYVGSDITLKANTAEVADAVVTITSAKKDASSGKYNIIANRAVADGWTVKDRGFVCGYTNVVPENWDEIDLNNPATGIRVTHGTPTASKQFNYIVKIAAGKQVRFYAYIVIQKGNTTKVIHSDYVDVTGA